MTSFTVYGFRLYWSAVVALFLLALAMLAFRRFQSRLLFGLFILYLLLYTSARNYLPDARGLCTGYWGWAGVARQGWTALLLLGLAGQLARPGALWLRAIAGACFSLLLLYAPETTLPTLLAGLSLGGLCYLHDPRRSVGREFMAGAAGAAVTWLAIMAPVILRGELGRFLQSSYEASRVFMQGGGNLPFPPLFGVGRQAFLEALPAYLMPAAILSLLFIHWLRFLRGEAGRLLELPLSIYAAVSFVNALIRARTPHLLNVSLTFLLVLFLTLDRWTARRPEPPAAETVGSDPATARRPGAAPRRFNVRLATATVLALIPLIVLKPGLKQLAQGVAGRIHHPELVAGPRWQPIPLPRAGIWTTPGDWLDIGVWGTHDDPAAIRMIRALTGGRPTYIAGRKASLYYFLADTPCAVSFTDPSSECFTAAAFRLLRGELETRRPEYIFLLEDALAQAPTASSPWHPLGSHHGLLVFQRKDLAAVSVE
jgi:hypothetical protein